MHNSQPTEVHHPVFMETSKIIFLILLVCFARGKHYHSFMGPFRIVFHRVDYCPLEEAGKSNFQFYYHDERTHYKDFYRYSGNFTMPFTADSRLNMHVKLASWSNMGGWKDNAHIFKINGLCTALSVAAPEQWRLFRRSIGGELTDCPYLPGIYRFENLTIDFSNPPVKIFLYGRWRSYLQVVDKNKDILMCLQGYLDTVPK